MEQVVSQRRREIECELMRLEVDVWKDLNMEQQALVDEEQRKMDQLTESVSIARATFHQEVSEAVKEMDSAKLRRLAGRAETTSTKSKSQQTEHFTIEIEISGEERKALKDEVRVLEEAACLLDQHKRLADEPLEGEDFKRWQKDLSDEEEYCLRLRKQISELEEVVQESLRRPEHTVATSPMDCSWITDPWDQEPEEAATIGREETRHAVLEMTPSRICSSSGRSTLTGTGSAHGTSLKTLVPTRPPPPPAAAAPLPPARAYPAPAALSAPAAVLLSPRGEEQPLCRASKGRAGPSTLSRPGRFLPKKALVFKRLKE
ncbi:Stress response protein nst1 [Frankliniella fusca]|uniref:Stress response protein nst1 n=1 Tax=Frankliniella fusca TaxID=407009 RepID=A0AAE1I1A2_9NEOP|nr:Stress response protein nst1 [Frankliniella fusca]